MISAFSGFIAGMIHVLSGPDHLAAVAPLSVARGRSWVAGMRWGFGHSLGVAVVGILSLLFRELMPTELISSWAEHIVGITLIGIGLWGVRKALTIHVHAHTHTHGGEPHAHIHVHGASTAHHPRQSNPHAHTHAAFAVGTLHGLAGSSHFIGVLPALAFPSRVQAICYLVTYGLGTVLAMASFSSVIGLAARGMASGGTKVYQTLMMTCSVIAIAVGGFWLIY